MKKTSRLFLILVAGVLVSGIVYVFYVKSKISSIHALRSSINEAASMVAARDEQGTQNESEFGGLFPVRSDIAGFMEEIYVISKKYDIGNLTFEQKDRELIDLGSGNIIKAMPVSGKKPNIMYAYPVRISFSSGYRNQAEFVREMQNMKRLVTIKNLKTRRDAGLLATEMVIVVYSAEVR